MIQEHEWELTDDYCDLKKGDRIIGYQSNHTPVISITKTKSKQISIPIVYVKMYRFNSGGKNADHK